MIHVKENDLLKMCLLGSIAGLAFLYVIVVNFNPIQVGISEIGSDSVGKYVSVSGEISDMYSHKDGHIFFDLNQGSDAIRVVIWNSDVNNLKSRGMNISEICNGASVEISGMIEYYKGQIELVPVRSNITLL